MLRSLLVLWLFPASAGALQPHGTQLHAERRHVWEGPLRQLLQARQLLLTRQLLLWLSMQAEGAVSYRVQIRMTCRPLRLLLLLLLLILQRLRWKVEAFSGLHARLSSIQAHAGSRQSRGVLRLHGIRRLQKGLRPSKLQQFTSE